MSILNRKDDIINSFVSGSELWEQIRSCIEFNDPEPGSLADNEEGILTQLDAIPSGSPAYITVKRTIVVNGEYQGVELVRIMVLRK